MKRTRGLGGVYQRGQTWWIQFFVHGKRVRESAGSSNRADAVRLLKQRIADVQAGKPVGSQIDRTTLADLTEILLNDYRANGRRSIDRVEDAIKHLREFFAEIRLVKLTPDRFTAYQVQRRAEGAANATVNYELAMLRRGFRREPAPVR